MLVPFGVAVLSLVPMALARAAVTLVASLVAVRAMIAVSH